MKAMHILSSGAVPKLLCGAALLVASLAGASSALAHPSTYGNGKMDPAPRQQAGSIEITGQPLRIVVYSDGSLDVYHQKYVHAASYDPAGFFIAVGQTVYGPTHGNSLFTPVSQTGPSGSGTSASPWMVVTELQINDSTVKLKIIQTISYVNGDNFFHLAWEISNNGTGTTCLKAYHAADLYFSDDDHGFGYYDSQSGSVGGFNQARDWFMVFIPNPPATHYEEAYYSTIWDRLNTAADLQDSIDSTYIDNGAALQWNTCLQAGGSTTIGDQWSFGVSAAAVINPGGAAQEFRQPGPLTPEITTYIPTPLDISFDPKVIGTNLLLAAIAMIMFTIASEVLNRTLGENEVFLQRLLMPLKRLRDLPDRFSIGKRLGYPLWFELLKLVLVMLIYGFVFSLLEKSWNPFSLTGLYLFVTMVIAYGFVGLADDIVQWAAARHWKLTSKLSVRPGNLLIIVASTAFSRLFGILPGIMFGTPEAFNVDETALKDRRTENALLRIAAGVLFLILIASWLPTIITALILHVNLPAFFLALVGGLESFLLLVFAVTVQNIFLQMLALPNTFGQALARWSKPVWAIAFLAATFFFLHTLLNPRGDLAKALGSTNIIFFLATIFLFLVFTVFVWLFFLVANAVTKEPAITPAGFPVTGPLSKRSTYWIWGLLVAFVMFCLCLIAIAVIIVFVLRR